MRTLYCLYQESSKPSKTNTKFLLNFGVQQVYFFYVMLCYTLQCHVMSCHVNRHSCNIISRYVMLF